MVGAAWLFLGKLVQEIDEASCNILGMPRVLTCSNPSVYSDLPADVMYMLCRFKY